MDENIIKELNKGKQPIFLEDNELQYIKNPIGNAHYKKALENSNKKTKDDYIICDICGKGYTKSNKSRHNKSKHHLFCQQLNKKWRKMILDN